MSLRVKEGLAIAIGVSLAVLIATLAHLTTLARLRIDEAASTGSMLAQQLSFESRSALTNTRDTPSQALQHDPGTQSLLQSMVGYSPTVVYGAITDLQDRALVHSNPSQIHRVLPERESTASVVGRGHLPFLQLLVGPPQILEVQVPLLLGVQPFGMVRVGISTALVRHQLEEDVKHSLLLSLVAFGLALVIGLVLGDIILKPLRQISAGVDRLVRGEMLGTLAVDRRDELGELAARLNQLGKRIHENRAQLLGEKSRLEQTVRVLQDAVLFVNHKMHIVFANPAADRLFGRPLPEGLEGGMANLLGDDHPLVQVAIAAIAPGARPVTRHVRITLPEGRNREVTLSAYPVQKGGAVEGAVLAIQDIEAAKAVLSPVDYSARLVEFGRLTSGAAHEIKNPLNAMGIHLELIRRDLPPHMLEARESLDVVAKEVRRLDRIVQGLLTFIRPEELRWQSVDVVLLFKEVASLVAAEAEKAGAHIVERIDPEAGNLMGDLDCLCQALVNLVQNAIQAMPERGTITLHARLQDGQVELAVEDQGVGIPEEDLDKVFRLYYTTKPGGSGLGLSLVYRAALLHGGRVRIHSVVGTGTMVTLTLPQFRQVYEAAA